MSAWRANSGASRGTALAPCSGLTTSLLVGCLRLLGQSLGIDDDPIEHTHEVTLVLDPARELIRCQPQLVALGEVPPSDDLAKYGVFQFRLQREDVHPHLHGYLVLSGLHVRLDDHPAVADGLEAEGRFRHAAFQVSGLRGGERSADVRLESRLAVGDVLEEVGEGRYVVVRGR